VDLGGLRRMLPSGWLGGGAPEPESPAADQEQGDRRIRSLARLSSLPLELPTFADVAVASARRVAPCEHIELLCVEGHTFANPDGTISGRLAANPALDSAVRTAQTRRSRPVTRAERAAYGPKLRLVVYVPVGPRGSVVGVLAFAWRSLKLAGAADMAAVEELATGLAPGLSAALVHQGALEAERDALTLVEAVSALARTHTVDAVAETACLYARKVARARRSRVGLITDGELQLSATNPDSRHPAHTMAPPSPGMHEAASSRELVEESTPVRITLSYPIIDGDRCLGVLQFDFSQSPAGVSDRTRRLCEAVATHTAAALERAYRTHELAWLATTDPLTGLANRRRLQADLCREIARADRSGEPLAVTIIDLDHFKRYNDEHGHLEGDLLLSAFGRFLNAEVRTMDTVGRYGGEEFLLILGNTTASEADSAAGRLMRAWGADGRGTTFSAGVAQWQRGETPDDLLERADTALYAAKHAGRDRVEVSMTDEDIDLTLAPQPNQDEGEARVVPLHEAAERRRGRSGEHPGGRTG